MKTRYAALALLWGYLVSPLLLQQLLVDGRGWLDPLFLFNVFTSLAWLGFFSGLRLRPLKFHLWAAPLYVLAGADLFMLFNYGNRLSSAYFGIALTDYRESIEFVAAFLWPVLATLGIFLAVYLLGLSGIRRLPAPRAGKLCLVSLSLLLAVYAGQLLNTYRNEDSWREAVLDVLGKELGAPMGPVFQGALALVLRAEAGEMLAQRREFSFARVVPRETSPRRIFVWIVGESSRPQNWSLMGYARETTPRLLRTPGVVPLPDLLTNAPLTAPAVVSMFSLRPVSDWKGLLAERSVISAFNQAGFATYWLSTQEADGWGGFIQHVAAEAQQRRYFDRALDRVLVDALRDIVRNRPADQPVFIVLHTKGSHWRYDRRYPGEFALFRGGQTAREKLVDAYDNSILYTDWVVSEVIRIVAAEKSEAAVLYVSDHGQNLLDDERQLFGHAIGSRFDLQSAALFWLSPTLIATHPREYRHLQQHRDWPLSMADLPHSFLDIAGISVDGFNVGKSVFRAQYAPHERWYLLRGKAHKEAVGR